MDFGSWLLQLVIYWLLATRRIQCLLVTDINVPQIVDFRDNVTLSCSYDISGHTLNSVKWYKNDSEFFRYAPLMQTVFRKFPVQGVQLIDDGNECNESSCRVELNLLGVKSSGVYRCEVSGDAPHFKLTARAGNMSVEALPQNNPLISSFHSMYRFDDFVQVNCSTDFSSLLTKITWYINGVRASILDMQPSVETSIAAHDYNLRRIVSQLNFYANDPRFHQLQLQQLLQQRQQQQQQQQLRSMSPLRLGLELRCVAEIESYPQLMRETSLQAHLFRDDIDLKNQKLFKSAAPGVALLSAQLLLVAATATAAAISTQWLFMPLTLQHGAKKLTRYKNVNGNR
ncbi:GH18359 [Drosophila grimshawi]|uniref:GH18359 n=1 Tax=Drosophila grimshawi TaxID=7222 RepID=B4JEY2_DROGR|nr:GH18359 [Drosophila grimshawi]